MPLDALSVELRQTLDRVSVPTYVLDNHGVVRWLNHAGRNLVGDVRGRQFTSLVAPEEIRHVRDTFARKVAGRVKVTDFESIVIGERGEQLRVQVSSVPLFDGERVVGVFGQLPRVDEAAPPLAELDLTPRQAEILRLLERGRTTDEIAGELHLSRETVRNHVRNLLRALGVRSRLEAVALSHGDLVAVR